jgi:hypothetical protein
MYRFRAVDGSSPLREIPMGGFVDLRLETCGDVSSKDSIKVIA